MHIKRGLISIWLFLLLKTIVAQNGSSLHTEESTLSGDTLFIKQLNINPSTIEIKDSLGRVISPSQYAYLSAKNCIVFRESPSSANLTITYRCFPFPLNKTYYSHLYSYADKDKELSWSSFKEKGFKKQSSNFSDYSQLNKTGYLSRGIGFGNNQDVIVNSALNLQLNGVLTENIKIKAAITDNNIPIQPEGNTQQIQEFDKVSITLYNDNHSLTLGDFEIKSPEGYFLQANKKLMGGTYQFQKKYENDRQLNTLVAGAVAKGKFNRMNIQGQEGVQGPYRLRGANNESYIMVLSGTEKVYVNGQRMKRGEAFDYVIDYNLAELKFTSYRLITKDDRIVVEFEYSDKNYTKFTTASYTDYQSKNSHFWLNVLSDHESKSQPVNAEYSDSELAVLEQAGDNLLKSVIPSIDSLGFSPSELRYAMQDSLGYDSVLVYSTDPKKAIYRVLFSFVGENKGDYLPSNKSAANGKVYYWVAPDDKGQKRGSYLPVKVLIPARSQQMVSAGAAINLKTYTQLFVETALSNNNKNTFSEIDQNDNVAWAYKLKIQQDLLFKDTAKTHLRLFAENENVNSNFTAFESFRSVEYNRNWSYTPQEGSRSMNYAVGVDWKQNDKWQSTYRLDQLKTGNYSGLKHQINGRFNSRKWHLNTQASWLESDYKGIKNRFLRSDSKIKYQWTKQLDVGLEEKSEHNTFREVNTGLQNNSYAFLEWTAFSNFKWAKVNRLSVNYKNRLDQSAYKGVMGAGSRGESFSLLSDINSFKSQKIKLNMTWRRLHILDSVRTPNAKDEHYFLGHIQHKIKLFKNAISLSSLYELSSGLELKKEFAYVEVPAGQGIYRWVDYNNDGVQQLNEFELAKYADQKKFIRVNISSRDYVRVFMNEWTETLNLNPYKVWRHHKGIKGFVAKFSDVLVYKTRQKMMASSVDKIINPLSNNEHDSSLVTLNQMFRNTFSFNRIHSVFGLDYIYSNNKNKSLLVNGFDLRTLSSHALRFRLNLSRVYSLNNELKKGEKAYQSDFFIKNNYLVSKWSNRTDFTAQINQNLRLNGHYTYKDKKNKWGKERLYLNELGLEVKYNIVERSNIQFKADFFKFNYNAESNTPVAFEMLEGLLPGNNMSWSVLFQMQISKYLQLNVSYLGRASEDSPVVHNGQAQLRAFF